LKEREDLAGYWLLATGYWLLATGYWLLATGYWLLATGYWLLPAPASRNRNFFECQGLVHGDRKIASQLGPVLVAIGPSA
jgi:hypothetical protein